MPTTVARVLRAALLFAAGLAVPASAQRSAADTAAPPLVLAPDAVWDGVADSPHAGWLVVVRGQRIEAVGPADRVAAPAGAEGEGLPGTTLIPGPFAGHSHLLLLSCNQTLSDAPVFEEPIRVLGGGAGELA